MATAGTIMFELKIAVEAEDGEFYVDATTTESGVVHEWTEGRSTQRPRRARASDGTSPCPQLRRCKN